MLEKKKATFTVKIPQDREDRESELVEVKLDVRRPSLAEMQEAQLYYNRNFSKYISKESNAVLRTEVNDLLEKRGLWNKEKETQLRELEKELASKLHDLAKGGVKLTDARKKAIDIQKLRAKISIFTLPRNILDSQTAEAQAEQDRFTWFVANCTVYTDKGTPVFDGEAYKDNTEVTLGEKRIMDYLEHASEEYAQECAKQFSILQYGMDPNFTHKFPENEFLLKFKFAKIGPKNEVRLINRDNQYVDEDWNIVDEDNFRLDKNGNKIDINDNPIDKDGKQIVEYIPFTDDNGNPVE
jgi:hypothetical protein